MKVDTEKLSGWVLDDVLNCSNCSPSEGGVIVCGWHENVTAAAAIVAATAGTIVREDDPLPDRLRRFADRAAQCWEGSDADHAISAMLEAADLLDNPVVRRWPHTDECRCGDCKSMAKLVENVPDLLDGDR